MSQASSNYRTMAELYIKGLTGGHIDPAEVIAWADDLLCNDPDTQDWMIDLSTAGADDRMGVVHHLHAVKGEVDEAALNAMLSERGWA
ncbi:hypothetical protein [Actomonas aquatica]|uniref:Uncharacterized protein n=1 Tax=Actomonas aquatica TaxID=2866162 RepID=A0ABZ1C2M7_9BACT|nr:hypothetical protein [Opitutus sp. WL0086]WRQ85840.1 hypothetical protein K1X11_013590 [Opitutus sp. WL0086]